MRPILAVALALALSGLVPSAASAQKVPPAMVGQTSMGPALTDPKGMTLYTYSRDMAGYSNCNDACAAAWPPLVATAEASPDGDWTIIPRDDGARQWAYKGHPLYGRARDAAAGETGGDGADNGKWRIAKP